MKRKLVGVFLLLAASFSVVYSQSTSTTKPARASHVSQENGGTLIEKFSFVIKDFKMDHQTETNNLNI